MGLLDRLAAQVIEYFLRRAMAKRQARSGIVEVEGWGAQKFTVGDAMPLGDDIKPFFGGAVIPFSQNAQFGVFTKDRNMHVCTAHRARADTPLTELIIVTPDGQTKHKVDLASQRLTHIFGVLPWPSVQTNTWKCIILTFPPDLFGVGERMFYFHDTGIGVNWSEVF